MSRSLPTTTRPFPRNWPTHHQQTDATAGVASRACAGRGGALVMSPLPQAAGGGRFVYAGMDPSSPATYVRPWRPVPGMIAYLNFDGAAPQSYTETGGLYGLPAANSTLAGVRPPRTRI